MTLVSADTHQVTKESNSLYHRIWAISDVHVDYAENKRWVDDLPKNAPFSSQGESKVLETVPFGTAEISPAWKSDVLIVAGDLAESLEGLKKALLQFTQLFGKVFFMPGNHDLWLEKGSTAVTAEVSPGGPDDVPITTKSPAVCSWAKLRVILKMCHDLGVCTTPETLRFSCAAVSNECASTLPSATMNMDFGRSDVAHTGESNQRNSRDTVRELNQQAVPPYVEVRIVPLFSWHHISWDREPEVTPQDQSAEFRGLQLPFLEDIFMDFLRTSWPMDAFLIKYRQRFPELTPIGSTLFNRGTHYAVKNGIETILTTEAIAMNFDELNDSLTPKDFEWEAADDQTDSPSRFTISFSHFLPDQRLIPEKRALLYPPLMKVCGSSFLAERIARLKPDVHIFGHTHFAWDDTLDDRTRYIQACVAYPQERKRRYKSLALGDTIPLFPVLVFKNCGFVPEYSTLFVSRYRTNGARDPSNIKIAPWVEDAWKSNFFAKIASTSLETHQR